VSVLNVDVKGNYWRETLSLKEALSKILRFVRLNPQSMCAIELRELDTVPKPACHRERDVLAPALPSRQERAGAAGRAPLRGEARRDHLSIVSHRIRGEEDSVRQPHDAAAQRESTRQRLA
jgi:hypothetical protein